MAEELQLGIKHECQDCGIKYYDFGKPEVLCPKCGAGASDKDDSADAKPKTKKKATKKKTAKKA